MRSIAFLIPGDITLPTGGYAYDRAVIQLLPGLGVNTMHVALHGAWPNPTEQDLQDAADIVSGLPADCLLLIDGLAYGAIPQAVIKGFNRQVIALCHHPLALENGISPDRAVALHSSETEALALAQHVLVTSPLTGKILEGDFALPAEKITVAEPGTTRKARATGSGSAELHLLAVGSIVPRKGYAVLIEALAGLRKRNWKLRIAGSARNLETIASLRDQIRIAGLDDNIHILGAVRDRELDSLYEKADLFVMSSLFEGYGMVLAEALQRGLPIITTTGGAASQTVPDGAGLKVAPGDADALRGAIERAIDDPALRHELSQSAWLAGQNLPRWEDTAAIIARTLKRFAT